MFYAQGVDLVIQAHEHSYERMWPTYNDEVYSYDYNSPKAPVHIISGAAGSVEGVDWMSSTTGIQRTLITVIAFVPKDVAIKMNSLLKKKKKKISYPFTGLPTTVGYFKHIFISNLVNVQNIQCHNTTRIRTEA